MLYKSRRKKMCKNFLIGGLLCLAGFTMFSCSDTYDLDEKQPSDNSRSETIYSFMEKKGNFKIFLQLIKDLGYDEVLSKTGSKTLFPANDDAFDEFFKSNEWGVSKYDDLSLAQKKLLLNSAMIDNPYSTSMLSTSEGPVKGEVCRRLSSLSIFDSVQVVSTTSEELPQNDRWFVLRNRPEVVLFKDASGASPMIHFTQKFLDANQVESSDIDFLYNDQPGTRQPGETYVNRAKIVESGNCKNGFVHIVDRVIVPLDNMAEVIRKNNDMSIYSSIIERFAAPADSVALTNAYNQNKGTEVDSIFVKRYFSERSWGSGTDVTRRRPFNFDKDKNPSDALLKYDPGWNTFVPEIFNNRTPMMEDMAVMLAPTDDAIKEWWDNGGGKVIKDRYGTIENTPNSVLAELVNVNMLNSLVASVPSRFSTILNDANMEMGVTLDGINKVHLGCNGVVYETNKVYAPASYSSVLFPAVIDTENLNIIKNAIDNMDYGAYLNSMVSRYSFFIPTNEGLLTYVDPVSYGKKTTEIWEFHYDDTKSQTQRIYADVYEGVDDGSGNWIKTGSRLRQVTGGTGNTQIYDRMEDILDNIIGVEEAYEGKKYIVTKGKNYIEVGGTFGEAGSMTACGTWQSENNQPAVVKEIYNMDNGKAYIVDAVLTGTRKATSDILAEQTEFSEFYSMMSRCGMFGMVTSDNYTAASRNQDLEIRGNLVTSSGSGSTAKTYSLLNAFHYTIYVPTNDAMNIAYAAGLPTLDDLTEAEKYDTEHEDEGAQTAQEIIHVMRDFVRYHIQNNAVYLDNGFITGQYESMRNKLELAYGEDGYPRKFDEDGKALSYGTTAYDESIIYGYISGSPYRININTVNPSAMTITDAMGYTIHILTSGGLYNMQAREYWLGNSLTNSTSNDIEKATHIMNSSSVVLHAVDRPLLFDKDQFKYVPRVIVADD